MANETTHPGAQVKARITVYPRPEILDPQGKAIASTLARLGFEGIDDVRAGKSFEVKLQPTEDTEATLHQMCKDLLVNSVVEDYTVEIIDDEGAS